MDVVFSKDWVWHKVQHCPLQKSTRVIYTLKYCSSIDLLYYLMSGVWKYCHVQSYSEHTKNANVFLNQYVSGRSTVVACWTAGQQIQQSILHLGHDPFQIHLRLSPAQYSLTTQSLPKTPFISFHIVHVSGCISQLVAAIPGLYILHHQYTGTSRSYIR